MEETGVPAENHWHAASHWQTLSHNVVSSTIPRSGIRTQSISGDRPDCICMHVINSTTIRPQSRQPLQIFFFFFLTKIIRSKKKLTMRYVIIVGTPSEQFFNYFECSSAKNLTNIQIKAHLVEKWGFLVIRQLCFNFAKWFMRMKIVKTSITASTAH